MVGLEAGGRFSVYDTVVQGIPFHSSFIKERVSELISFTGRDGKAPVVVSDVGVDDIVRHKPWISG
jgi:hypothetical protein